MVSKHTLVLPTIFLVFLLVCAEGQLTFSPDWGKRSQSRQLFGQQMEKCKTSNEILLEIFRFVQNERDQFLDCQHRE